MPRRSLGPCVFCGEPSSPRGEHVLPTWFRSRYQSTTFDRDLAGGQTRRTNHFEPPLLPACPDCNGTLNVTYETAAEPVVRAVLDQRQPLTEPGSVDVFARWWVKTLLLLRHPKTRLKGNAPPWPIEPWDLPQKAYEDLLAGQIVDDLSIWVAIHDERAGKAKVAGSPQIHLSSVPDLTGTGWLQPATTCPGFSPAKADGTGMYFSLIWHPRTDFAHPFETAGLAARLWPTPPTTVDLWSLPTLSYGGLRGFRRCVTPAGAACALDPGWRLEIEEAQGLAFTPPVFVAPDGTRYNAGHRDDDGAGTD